MRSFPEKWAKRNKHPNPADGSDADDTSSIQPGDEEDTIPETQVDGVQSYLEQDDHDSMVRQVDIWKNEINLELTRKRLDLKDGERRLEKRKESVDQIQKSVDQMKKDIEETQKKALSYEDISARLRKR